MFQLPQSKALHFFDRWERELIEGFGALATVVSKILDIFKQKVYVYVEVSINQEPPYCLKVVNRSGYEVLINDISVDPDGFPEDGNGWHLAESTVFKNKILKPGQAINFYLYRDHIGQTSKRTFSVQYQTLLGSKKIPRKEQSCESYFDLSEHRISLHKSLKLKM